MCARWVAGAGAVRYASIYGAQLSLFAAVSSIHSLFLEGLRAFPAGHCPFWGGISSVFGAEKSILVLCTSLLLFHVLSLGVFESFAGTE